MYDFLTKIMKPEFWLLILLANCFMLIASVVSDNSDAALLNVLSAVACVLGYVRAKKREGS